MKNGEIHETLITMKSKVTILNRGDVTQIYMIHHSGVVQTLSVAVHWKVRSELHSFWWVRGEKSQNFRWEHTASRCVNVEGKCCLMHKDGKGLSCRVKRTKTAREGWGNTMKDFTHQAEGFSPYPTVRWGCHWWFDYRSDVAKAALWQWIWHWTLAVIFEYTEAEAGWSTEGGLEAIGEGFPGGSDGKRICFQYRKPSSTPGLGRSPGEGNGCPLHYLPGESHGQRSLMGCTPWGPKDADTTE